MKVLFKIYGLAKIAISLLAFVINWFPFFQMIKTVDQINIYQMIGGVIAFLLLLVFSVYLFNSGLSDVRNNQMITPKFQWVGIISGITISCLVFYLTIYRSFPILLLLVSLVETIRSITKKKVAS